jgi:hypothetical protein
MFAQRSKAIRSITASRRWLQFTLKMMLGTVLLFSCILAWLARERAYILKRRTFAEQCGIGYDVAGNYLPNAPILIGREIPWWRKLLGDEPYVRFDIVVPNEGLALQIQELFPEAVIVEGGMVRPGTERPDWP